jgi:hypothetical protein
MCKWINRNLSILIYAICLLLLERIKTLEKILKHGYLNFVGPCSILYLRLYISQRLKYDI